MATDALLDRLSRALAGRYAVVRELGHGGMATVYLGTDLKLGRQVAIKVLAPATHAYFGPERFRREILVGASLKHPHIVPVFDADEADDFLYYVMEYVEGESLEERLAAAGPLPLEEALRLTTEIGDALQYAHAAGVIHRDIKPANILLSHGHALVSDFGIAKLTEGEDRSTSPSLTDRGAALGTPEYMSPEQARGARRIDVRTDVYGLAATLYAMLAGEPPFTGPSGQAVLARVLSDPPRPIRTVCPNLPPHIERALEQGLAKERTDRYPTPRAFVDAIEHAIAKRPVGRFVTVRRFAAALGAALVAVVGAVLLERIKRLPAVDPNLVVVAPFDILDARFELWHEGLVDYLSRNLDGAGPLRTVSPTLVLRRWNGRADPASARELGRRVGARLVVFGQVVGAGLDSVRLRVTVLDAATARVVAEPERTDLADRIDRLADSLTTDVLRHLGGMGSEVHFRVASLGTKSFPALKAFLKGEQLLRRFSLDSALEAYAEAVRRDTSFALALRRIALAGGWRGQSGDSLDLRAGRLNHGLAPRDSLLITSDSLEAASDDSLDPAYWSHRVRKFAVLEEASHRYPEDPEVWYSLGEARFHYGYVVGTTARHALDAFDRAIALDTTFAPAYFHPVQLALDRDDTAAARRYVDAYVRLTSEVPEGAGIRLVDRFLNPAGETSPEFQHLLDTTSANTLFDAWRSVERWPDASEVGVRLLRLLAKGRRGQGVSADTVWNRYLLAAELLYRGHLREVRSMVGSRASVLFAELAVLGVVAPESAAASFDRWLRSANEPTTVGDPPGVNPCYLSFTVASWWARNHDTIPLLRLMRRGDSVARAARSPASLVKGRCYAALARAALPLARRDTAEALRRFLAFPDSLCPGLGALQLDPLRMVRFQLLAAAGRYRGAALLFDQQVSAPLTATSVVARLERGRIAERLGDRATAIQAYHFVTAVWRYSDPELLLYVAEARAALARLGGEAG